ncbi:hypothetical protein pb186bvf_019484 [Paramecium bursaria]
MFINCFSSLCMLSHKNYLLYYLLNILSYNMIQKDFSKCRFFIVKKQQMIKIIQYAVGGIATTSLSYNYFQKHYELDLGIYDFAHKTLYKQFPKQTVIMLKTLCYHNLLWINKFPLQDQLGLAAGFDTLGSYLQALHDLGFGFVEVGSVSSDQSIRTNVDNNTYENQDGTIKHQFDLPTQGILKVKSNIINFKKNNPKMKVGVNISPTEDILIYTPYLIDTDIENSFRDIVGIADYAVINLIGSQKSAAYIDEFILKNRAVFPNMFSKLKKAEKEEIGIYAAIQHEKSIKEYSVGNFLNSNIKSEVKLNQIKEFKNSSTCEDLR